MYINSEAQIMGDYSVPGEIRALKPQGSIVKKIKNNYYVYSHSQKKDEKTGKWKTKPGELLGKIVPGVGYCPRETKTACLNKITCFDYGEYFLACSLARDEFLLLKKVFNADEAMRLFFISSYYALNGFAGIKSLAYSFERSLIAKDYPSLKFSYHLVTALLEAIGRTDKQKQYQKEAMSTSSDTLAFDGHVIPTFSEDNSLASAGFKTAKNNCTYMNLMVALDVKNYRPVGTKVFPGYMLDKSDFIAFCDGIGDISGKIVLIDMGFFSQENLDYIEGKKGFYVIPLSSNLKEHRLVRQEDSSALSQFLYHRNGKIDTVEYREKIIGGKKVVYYRNITEAEKLSTLYLVNLESGKDGYTQENYQTQKDDFGVIVLKSNLDKNPKELYELYKSRWSIETYYDRLKNGIRFEALNLDDYATIQGLCFVLMVASRIDAKILGAAKKAKMPRKELIQLMRYLKLVKDGENTVRIHNMKTTHQKIFEALGISLDVTKKCLG